MNHDIVVAVVVLTIFGILLLVRAFVSDVRQPAHKRKPKSRLNYQPRGDRVIVERLPRPEQAPDQVFIPDSQQRPFNEGTAVAVGPDVEDLAPGDHVCFVDFAGTAVEIDGVEYLSMREVEVHGKRA